MIGGGGADILALRGSQQISLTDANFSAETVSLISASDTRFGQALSEFDYSVFASSLSLAAGQTLTVNGAGLRANETMEFNGNENTLGIYRLFGGAANDVLLGGGGSDLIFGGVGADFLRGRGGNDVFRYQSVIESKGGFGVDRIGDFTSGDLIDLSRIDAIAGTPENDAFDFIGSGAFTKVAGQLRVTFDPNIADGSRLVQADTDGDGFADFEISVFVTNGGTLSANDFVV